MENNKRSTLIVLLVFVLSIGVINCFDTNIKVGDKHTVRVKSAYNVNNGYLLNGRKADFDDRTKNWNLDEGVCWLTNRTKWKA